MIQPDTRILLMKQPEGIPLFFYASGWETKILHSIENQINEYPIAPVNYEDGVWYRKLFDVGDADSGKIC